MMMMMMMIIIIIIQQNSLFIFLLSSIANDQIQGQHEYKETHKIKTTKGKTNKNKKETMKTKKNGLVKAFYTLT
jgi:hypothetical protein